MKQWSQMLSTAKNGKNDAARKEEMSSLGSLAESRIFFFGEVFRGELVLVFAKALTIGKKLRWFCSGCSKDFPKNLRQDILDMKLPSSTNRALWYDKSILPWNLISLRNIRGIRSIKVTFCFRFLTWLTPWGLPKPCNSEEVIYAFLLREPYQPSLSTVKRCFCRTQLIQFNHFSFLCSHWQDLVQLSQLQQGSTSCKPTTTR